jgi:sialate O-acetylesterase
MARIVHISIAVKLGILLAGIRCAADVHLPALFSDHAVLQRAEGVPVWGRAEPGESISIQLGTMRTRAVADQDGQWRVTLDLRQAPEGAVNLTVIGNNTFVAHDIVVGEVWLASGQSNMEWPLRDTMGAADEIAHATNPAIRFFTVSKRAEPLTQEEPRGKWLVVNAASAGDLTGVGYYFAKALQQEIKGAVGIVHASWGGTPIEAWISEDGFRGDPDLWRSLEAYRNEAQSFNARLESFCAKFHAWSERWARHDVAAASPPTEAAWKKYAPIATATSAAASGSIWLRTRFSIPPEAAGLGWSVELGTVDGFYTMYFNRIKVAEFTPRTGAPGTNGVYIRPELMREGEAEILLRIYNPVGAPGLRGQLTWNLVGHALTADWEVFGEQALAAPGADAVATFPAAPRRPEAAQNAGTYLYNGMIAPLARYAMRGVIWYQGESNTPRAWQYRTVFRLLIRDWRTKWNEGNFPFYFCQLANRGQKSVSIVESNWAELREAQSHALEEPNTGQAVLIDIGEADDVHARNKREVGARLARLALARTYGRRGMDSGPVYRAMKVEGSRIRLFFDHCDHGLVAQRLPRCYQPRSTHSRKLPLDRNSPGSELEGFAICGVDRRWVWAQAKIADDTVLVWSSTLSAPIAVRYAWADNPTCNLYNTSGLPASPFRTDEFPVSTQGVKY